MDLNIIKKVPIFTMMKSAEVLKTQQKSTKNI